jgi:heptosyltransferase I
MQVVLTGGSSVQEVEMAEKILSICNSTRPLNLIGKTGIDDLVAVLQLADIVIAPDTGPVHIASALGTDTIGLYAATNPDRAGPYNHQSFVVNRYPQALLKYNNKTVEDASWGERVKTDECMALITVDDVAMQIDNIISQQDEKQHDT